MAGNVAETTWAKLACAYAQAATAVLVKMFGNRIFHTVFDGVLS